MRQRGNGCRDLPEAWNMGMAGYARGRVAGVGRAVLLVWPHAETFSGGPVVLVRQVQHARGCRVEVKLRLELVVPGLGG